MRISLTALTDQGARDVVVNGDSDMTVGTVARSLIATLNADAVKEPLAQVVRLPSARWVEDPPHPLWAGGRMLDPTAPAGPVPPRGALLARPPRPAPPAPPPGPRRPAPGPVRGGPG